MCYIWIRSHYKYARSAADCLKLITEQQQQISGCQMYIAVFNCSLPVLWNSNALVLLGIKM